MILNHFTFNYIFKKNIIKYPIIKNVFINVYAGLVIFKLSKKINYFSQILKHGDRSHLLNIKN